MLSACSPFLPASQCQQTTLHIPWYPWLCFDFPKDWGDFGSGKTGIAETNEREFVVIEATRTPKADSVYTSEAPNRGLPIKRQDIPPDQSRGSYSAPVSFTMATISREEVSQHSSKDSCWLIIHDKIWDATGKTHLTITLKPLRLIELTWVLYRICQ